MMRRIGRFPCPSITQTAVLLLMAALLLRLLIIVTKPRVLWLDDTFYSLGIARHLALGHGPTHDGLHLTNGFQPLWVWLMIPVYSLFPNTLEFPAVLALVFGALLNLGTGFLIFRLCLRYFGPVSAFFVLLGWSFSPYVISGVNGMETSLSFFLIVLAAWLYLNDLRERPSIPSTLLLGLVLGLSILARIDSALFALCLLGSWSLSSLIQNRKLNALKRPVVTALLMTLIITPWLTYNQLQFGSPVPESGNAIRQRSLAGGEETGLNIFYVNSVRAALEDIQRFVLTPFLPFSRQVGLPVFALAAIVGAAVWFAAARQYAVIRPSLDQLRPFAFIFIWAVLLAVVYAFYQHGSWFFQRYFYPLLLPGSLLAAGAIQGVWALLKSFTTQTPTWLRYGLAAVMVAGYLLLLPGSLPRPSNPILGREKQMSTYVLYQAADWLAENSPEEATAAAFQSGIIGYFSERPVINLDGVVNSAALPSFLAGTTHQYLAQNEVDYVADWDPFLELINFEPLSYEVAAVFTQPPGARIIHLR